MSDDKVLSIAIYRATSPSGKVYIGLSKDFDKRKKDHIRAANNPNDPYYNEAFKRAIRKYGDNIEWEILIKVNSYSEAHYLEKKLIKQNNSYGDGGYNMTLGGDGNSRPFTLRKHTAESILKNALKYSNVPEWNEKDRKYYLAAKRLDKHRPNFFNECVRHMSTVKRRLLPPNKKWTTDKIILEAKKFSTKTAMKKCSSSAYSALNVLKKTDLYLYLKITKHMGKNKNEQY